MRDVLLLGILLGVLPFALRHTWIGVLLWTWFSLMNPHRLTYGFAYDAPFAAIAAGATLLSLFITRDKLTMPWDPPVKVLFGFVVWMCLTTAFAFYPWLSWEQLTKILKIQVMTAIAFAALKERKHIELFIWINVLSIGFYGFKGGIFTIISGGAQRVWGPGGFIGGNNEIGLALVMIIPLVNYLRTVATRAWLRAALLVLMLLSATAVLGTQSRGAFVAISAMGVFLWFRSDKKAMSALSILFVGIVLLAFMPSSWEARMRTIGDYQQDGSAMGRINAWFMAFNLANDRLFGGGFEVATAELFARYAPVPGDIRAAHSIYFQVLGEHGYVGLILFVSLLVLAFRTASAIRLQAVAAPEGRWLGQLAAMCQVSLIGYAVGGAFLSLSYFDLPYNIVVVLVVSLRWLKERRWEREPQGAFGASSPPPPIAVFPQREIRQW